MENVAKTINLPDNLAVVKGTKSASSSSGIFSKISDFLSGIFERNSSNGPKAPTVKTPNSTSDTTVKNTGLTMEPISAIVAGLGAISNGVFSFLGSKQETKQKELDLVALEKQKSIVEAQGDIEETKVLTAKIEVQKQELINAQKKETGNNIVKLGVVLGVLALAGFVVFQVFKTPKAPKTNQMDVPTPQTLK